MYFINDNLICNLNELIKYNAFLFCSKLKFLIITLLDQLEIYTYQKYSLLVFIYISNSVILIRNKVFN